MLNYFIVKIGKIIHKISVWRGGGSAFPGLILEKLSLQPMIDDLAKLPHGIVVVSGTNGKTSTTKFLVEILSAQGLKVFTNNTGSNFVRGVASAWLKMSNQRGQLNADIAILELDEAHAIHFINALSIDYCLLLNVMRDQLDRFGELDQVAKLLEQIVIATKKDVILNGNDVFLRKIGTRHPQKTHYFGSSEQVAKALINIDNDYDFATDKATVKLTKSSQSELVYQIDDKSYVAQPKIVGLYNHYNITAAIAAAHQILKSKLKIEVLNATIANLTPAFGRGESFAVDNHKVMLFLVKNPSGFQSSLQLTKCDCDVLIAINDNYADGRDISWLWDVSFDSLRHARHIYTTGSRCHDMHLRLKYDDLTAQASVEDFKMSIKYLLCNNDNPKLIFATYTAMLKIRTILKRLCHDNDTSPLS